MPADTSCPWGMDARAARGPCAGRARWAVVVSAGGWGPPEHLERIFQIHPHRGRAVFIRGHARGGSAGHQRAACMGLDCPAMPPQPDWTLALSCGPNWRTLSAWRAAHLVYTRRARWCGEARRRARAGEGIWVAGTLKCHLLASLAQPRKYTYTYLLTAPPGKWPLTCGQKSVSAMRCLEDFRPTSQLKYKPR
jgi:hypothetical protein